MSLTKTSFCPSVLYLLLLASRLEPLISTSSSWLKTQGGTVTVDRTSQAASVSLQHSGSPTVIWPVWPQFQQFNTSTSPILMSPTTGWNI